MELDMLYGFRLSGSRSTQEFWQEPYVSWWEKKSHPVSAPVQRPYSAPLVKPLTEVNMPEPNPKAVIPASMNATRTILGPSVLLRGQLSSDEDLTIEGKFDGTLQLGAHCLTVGPQGEVKADIQVSRVVVQGAVTGNITARERIEIRKTGRVMGDLVAPGIAIEDGAYFKGSIEIVREDEPALAHMPSGAATEDA